MATQNKNTRIEKLTTALVALESLKRLGGLSDEEEARYKEIQTILDGIKILDGLYGNSTESSSVNDIKTTTPKVIEVTKMQVTTGKKTRKSSPRKANWPIEYNPTLTHRQKVYAVIYILGSCTVSQIRNKINELEPGVFNELQLTKMVELGTRKLGQASIIEYSGKPRIYSIKKAAEEAA